MLHNDGTGWRQATVNNYGANVYGLAGDGMVVYGVGNKGVNGDSIKAAAPYDTFNVQSSALGADLTGITLLSSGIGWVSGQNGFLGYFDTRP